MRYLIPKGGLMEPLVKRIVVETFFWEFLGLLQHIIFVPLHEPVRRLFVLLVL
jgi:hypothetical protein